MKRVRIFLILAWLLMVFTPHAFATTSSQILVMSKQLYAIAQDLTTGMFPTAVLLISIGMWGLVNVFGKGLGEGIHQLANIIAVGGIVIGASAILANATMFSVQM